METTKENVAGKSVQGRCTEFALISDTDSDSSYLIIPSSSNTQNMININEPSYLFRPKRCSCMCLYDRDGDFAYRENPCTRGTGKSVWQGACVRARRPWEPCNACKSVTGACMVRANACANGHWFFCVPSVHRACWRAWHASVSCEIQISVFTRFIYL